MGLLQICQTIEGVKDYSDDPWGWVDHGYIEDGALMCLLIGVISSKQRKSKDPHGSSAAEEKQITV